MPSGIECKVVSPSGVVFEGDVASIKGPGWEGRFGILQHHAPYLVRLLAGPLILQDDQGAELFGREIAGGFLMIANDQCTVLVEGLEARTKED